MWHQCFGKFFCQYFIYSILLWANHFHGTWNWTSASPLKQITWLIFQSCSRIEVFSSFLSLPLAQTMNNSVTTVQYPSKLNHAKVIAMFKGGDETNPSNYCPISLLSLFNLLFQKVIYNRLKSYAKTNGHLYNGQYGFCENISTQHPIVKTFSLLSLWGDISFMFPASKSLSTIFAFYLGNKLICGNLMSILHAHGWSSSGPKMVTCEHGSKYSIHDKNDHTKKLIICH